MDTVYVVFEDYAYGDRVAPVVFASRESAENYYLTCLTTMIKDSENMNWNTKPPETFLSYGSAVEWLDEQEGGINYFLELYETEVLK